MNSNLTEQISFPSSETSTFNSSKIYTIVDVFDYLYAD